MSAENLRWLLNDRRVIEEVNKHLWIESQKVGYSIGIEAASEDWLRLHGANWLKYHEPAKYEQFLKKNNNDARRKEIRKKAAGALKRAVGKLFKK